MSTTIRECESCPKCGLTVNGLCQCADQCSDDCHFGDHDAKPQTGEECTCHKFIRLHSGNCAVHGFVRRQTETVEHYCIECKQVARDDCEDRGHVVGTLGQSVPPTEQPAPETGEWRAERMPIHGWRILNENGSEIVRDIYSEETATAIVRDRRIAALMPELAGTLRDLSDLVTVHFAAQHENKAPQEFARLIVTAEVMLNAVNKELTR